MGLATKCRLEHERDNVTIKTLAPNLVKLVGLQEHLKNGVDQVLRTLYHATSTKM